jgi:hypothetical protein
VFKTPSSSSKWTIYGSKSPKAVIAGHSHTFALLMAIRGNQKYFDTFGLIDESKPSQLGKGFVRNSEYWSYVAKLSLSLPTFISWNGNQHNIHFLVDEFRPFQIQNLYQEYSSAPVVPIDQVKELFSPTFNELRSTLSRFETCENLTLLGTPAPKPKKYIDSILLKDEYFTKQTRAASTPGSKIVATSDELRQAMWKFTQIMTKEIADELGCKFMPTPQFSLDSKGLLREQFWSDDITHANQYFGELLLDDIAKNLEN